MRGRLSMVIMSLTVTRRRRDIVGSTNALAGGFPTVGQTPIQTAAPSPSTRDANNAVSSPTPISPSFDRVEISAVPSSSQVELVPNAAEFKVVVANAVLELRNVASRTSDPQEAAYLLHLAESFQLLQEPAGSSTVSNAADATSAGQSS